MTWTYCVVRIDDGETLYEGQNIQLAANALDPGTTYGRGATLQDARMRAHANRRLHLAAEQDARK